MGIPLTILDYGKCVVSKHVNSQENIFHEIGNQENLSNEIEINPTPVGGGRFPPPLPKIAITPKNNDPIELKLRDFSYILGGGVIIIEFWNFDPIPWAMIH